MNKYYAGIFFFPVCRQGEQSGHSQAVSLDCDFAFVGLLLRLVYNLWSTKRESGKLVFRIKRYNQWYGITLENKVARIYLHGLRIGNRCPALHLTELTELRLKRRNYAIKHLCLSRNLELGVP